MIRRCSSVGVRRPLGELLLARGELVLAGGQRRGALVELRRAEVQALWPGELALEHRGLLRHRRAQIALPGQRGGELRAERFDVLGRRPVLARRNRDVREDLLGDDVRRRLARRLGGLFTVAAPLELAAEPGAESLVGVWGRVVHDAS